jgi:uncharacterized membrane protein
MTVVIVTLLSTLLIQMGYFLWKVSADGQPQIGSAPIGRVAKAFVTDWRWMLGLAATSLGWVLFVQATALGDISLVQPLMSAGDLLLIVMAVVFLKERLGGVEWAGVMLTVLGGVALAWESAPSGLADFALARLQVLVAASLVGGSALLFFNRKARRPEVLLAMVVGLCFGLGAVITKAMTAEFSVSDDKLISWVLLTNLYLPAVVMVNVAGLVLLQAAFQRGRAAVIVPLQLAVANAVTVLAGLAIFGEQVTMSRAAGIVLILTGTALLHVHSHKLD